MVIFLMYIILTQEIVQIFDVFDSPEHKFDS